MPSFSNLKKMIVKTHGTGQGQESSEMSPSSHSWLVSLPSSIYSLTILRIEIVLSPLASSMFNPGIQEIASDLGVTETAVVGATTGFIVALGIGPLLLAPLSETFGRRRLYLVCFSIFSLLQIPTALSPNIATLISMRTISAFFGSKSSIFVD